MNRLNSLLLFLCVWASAGVAFAKEPPVQLACLALDTAQVKRVKDICASVGTNPNVKLVNRKGIWKHAQKHGLTTELITGRYSRFQDAGGVVSTLKTLDVEALMFVAIESDTKAMLITFGYDGHRARNPLPLVAGTPDPKLARQSGGFAVRDIYRNIAKFRETGGWDAVVSSAELDGLDPNEQMALRMKRSSRCFHFKTTWYFCTSMKTFGGSGFVFGKKGKPFTYVKSGGSVVKGVRLGTFSEDGFERAGELAMTSRDFDPFADGGAPALLVNSREGRAALACGKQTEYLTALSHADSRKLLADVTIRFAPASRRVRLMKTKNGTYAWEETIRHASGQSEHRVFVGKPPKMQEKRIVDRAYYSDGGTTVYAFADGGGLFLPANMWFMDPKAIGTAAETDQQTLPDGSKIPKAAGLTGRQFRWSKLLRKRGGNGEKLYVVDDAEKQSVLSGVQTPLPVQPAQPSAVAVCALVLPNAKE